MIFKESFSTNLKTFHLVNKMNLAGPWEPSQNHCATVQTKWTKPTDCLGTSTCHTKNYVKAKSVVGTKQSHNIQCCQQGLQLWMVCDSDTHCQDFCIMSAQMQHTKNKNTKNIIWSALL